MKLKKRIKKERVVRVRSRDIDAKIKGLVPVIVSESLAPGEALFICPDIINEKGEIDPNKVMKIRFYSETDISKTVIGENLQLEKSKGEK